MKGFEYIWRYLRGERKGKAANRLEREALSDPFLYEALEGLEEVQADHEQVMKELRRGLQPGMGERRRWKAVRWVAAASILLVGGVALWLLAGQEDPESGQVAWMMQEVKADSAVTESAVVAAVVSEADTIAVEEVKEEKGRRDTAPGFRDRKIVTGYSAKGRDAGTVVEPELAVRAAAGLPAEDSVKAVKNVNALLAKRLERVKVQPETSGTRSGVRIRGTSPARQQPPRKQVEEQQPENGVISYDTSKKRNRKPKSVASLATDWNKKSMGNLTWQQRFERYLSDSLRYPETVRVNGVEGEVKLSVRLNKRGKPSRIKVLQELTPECDQEAVRLVEFYPGVLGDGYAGKIEVTVSFRLKGKR